MSKLGTARLRLPRRLCRIPNDIKMLDTLSTFKACLKTNFYRLSFYLNKFNIVVPALIYLSYYVLTYLYIHLLIITSCTLFQLHLFTVLFLHNINTIEL